jgi:peptidyl-Lys metalloendopeptidase
MIHICPNFWTANDHEQAGILIMEASHWTDVAGTHDFSWSAADCRSLAATDPAQAIDNAASYAYFCVNIENQPIP